MARPKTLRDQIAEFKVGLNNIIGNIGADKMDYTHPQYDIKEIDDTHYDITISITGMGIQRFELVLVDDEFFIKGKMVDPSPAWPMSLVADLVNGLITCCYAQNLVDEATKTGVGSSSSQSPLAVASPGVPQK